MNVSYEQFSKDQAYLNMKTRTPPVRRVVFASKSHRASTAEIDTMVLDVLSRVADKWTMCVLEVLDQHGVLRFTRIGQLVGEISQRMLTKTLRDMEQDGLLTRTAYPEVPPRVEYALTELGSTLCAAFCSVWIWAEEHEAQLRAIRSGKAAPTKPRR